MQPASPRRHDEGDEIGDIVRRAQPDGADVRPVPFAHLGLALAGALHVSFHTTCKTLSVDIAWMDAIDLHAVGLAEIGQCLAERRHRRVHGTADGEARGRHSPRGAADTDQ